MERIKVITPLAVGALLAAGVAARADETVRARLHGFNEAPAVSSEGIGTFRAIIQEDSIKYVLRYSGLNSAAAAAHIHLGQRNVNGGVSAFLCGGGGKPACPPDGGTVSGTIDAADVIGPAGQGIAAGELDELIRAIRAGVTYANVHTATQGGGEIRGQLRVDEND